VPKEQSVADYQKNVPEFGTYTVPNPKARSTTQAPAGRKETCLEKYTQSNFWLGHVEFTDYGSFQDHKQLDVLERAVEADLKAGESLFRNGMTMLVYVHGWQNNAKDNNHNLEEFRFLLKEAADREKAKPNGVGGRRRGVLGVYVSWRGESWMVPGLKHLLTFWGRKRVAHDFGHGSLVETLARLKNLEWLVARGGRESNEPREDIFAKCRMVCVGHSFGAAALYSATAQPLEAKFLEPYWDKRRYGTGKDGRAINRMDRVTGLGDLVVLINPAFEALPYRALHHAMSTNTNVRYDANQPVLMMVLSSRNDVPNRSLLPIGQTLGYRFLDCFPWKNQQREASQRKTSLGSYKDFHTHTLDVEAGGEHLVLRRNPSFFGYGQTKSEDGDPFERTKPIMALEKDYHLHQHCVEKGLHVHVADVTDEEISRLPERAAKSKVTAAEIKGVGLLPFMVVSVDPQIINGHNGFWPAGQNEHAYQFIRTFIAAQNAAVSTARQTEASEGQSLHNVQKR
jgi:hypothetical protein